jgi:hypothetical protein
MYKVTAILHIHANFSGCSSDDVWLEKDFELPFPPVKGMPIEFPTTCDINCKVCFGEGMNVNPIEIYYHIDTGVFKVYVASDKELYNKALNERKTLLLHPKEQKEFSDELYRIVYFWRHIGWELRK